MPKPSKGESKQDFLKRCTGELVGKEDKSSDQAYAVCNGLWDDAHSQRAALCLAAPLELAPPDQPEGPAGFMITAYTGQIIDRGWYGKLIIDTGGIKTKAKMPVLREHQRDRVVGVGVKAWKDNHRLFIRGEYSGVTSDSQEVRQLAEEGFPWQASVGVWPKKIKVLDSDKETVKINGQTLTGPLEIWLESEVREVSFAALGADDETAAINFAEGERVKVQIERGQPQKHKEGQDMPITLVQLETEAPELLKEIRDQAREEGAAAGDQLRAAGRDAERARVVEILEAAGLQGLLFQVVQDGSEPKEALKLFLKEHDRVKAEALKAMEAAAPAPVGTDPPKIETAAEEDQNLPIETRAKAEWDKDAKLRGEFKSLETYLAFRKAEDDGRVKIKSK